MFEGRDVRGDAERAFRVIEHGGIAILPLTVAYAIACRTEAAIRKIYETKRRSFSKATGIMGTPALQRELHVLEPRAQRMVDRLVALDLPIGVIAPFRRDHPHLATFEPFVLANAVVDGTMNILLNVGELFSRMAELSVAEGVPVVGASANVSLTPTKFRFEDIEPELRAIADIAFDYGPSIHASPNRLASTMIDFSTMRVQREGACFDRIAGVLADEFGVRIAPPEV